MIWACFCGKKVGPILTFAEDETVQEEEYMDALFDGLLSFVDDLKAESPQTSWIFMQDNAPCHKTQDILALLQESQIEVMEWPGQSPDLNPIENLWTDLKARFHQRWSLMFSKPSQSRDNLHRCRELVQEVWHASSEELIDKLVKSMPRRVEQVFKAKGGSTKY
jgi:transposase